MIKKILRLISNNLLIFFIISGLIFALFSITSKVLFSKSKYIYVKVKVSQGLWWANTARPQIWMIRPLVKGLKETSLLGKPSAEIMSVTYYPWFEQPASQYDAFITVKIRVTGGGKKTSYEFNRNAVTVGSAINFEFPTVSVSGTVIEISGQPIKTEYKSKIIYLSKGYALDWEYEDIMVGDKFFNGEGVIFEILEKSSVDELGSLLNTDSTYTGSVIGATNFSQVRKRVTIKAKIRVKNVNGYQIFGEEQVIATGKDFFLALPSVMLNNYRITKIE